MAVNQNTNTAYSLNQPLSAIFPNPIISVRNPTTSDKAQLGTIWVNKSNNDGWVLTSIVNNSATWIGIGGGAGTFTDLTVTGTALFEGAFEVDSPSVEIASGSGDIQLTSTDLMSLTTQSASTTSLSLLALSGGILISAAKDLDLQTTDFPFSLITGTGDISIGTDAAAKDISIGNGTGDSSVELVSGTGGIILNGDGLVTMVPVTNTIASPTITATENFNVIRVIFSGFTTAIGATETFIINSNKITTTSGLLVQATNTDATATGASLQTTGIIQGNGNIQVLLENVGTGALNGNIIITIWVIS